MLNNTDANAVEKVARWAAGLMEVDPTAGTDNARTALAYLVDRAHARFGAGLRPKDIFEQWPERGEPGWVQDLRNAAAGRTSESQARADTVQIVYEVLGVALESDTDPIVEGLPHLPDGIDAAASASDAEDAEQWLQDRGAREKATWFDVLSYAVAQVAAAPGDRLLRRRLIELAAYAIVWTYAIEERTAHRLAAAGAAAADE